jgi:DNA polymerase
MLDLTATPRPASLEDARLSAAQCRRCDLYRNATQMVFGEGPGRAPVMLVGEQPGDQEDRQGHPFVGPAGRLLRQAMAEAGLDMAAVYVTNAVKHFKNEPRGKRRLHKRPDAGEIEACRWWLEAERTFVRPKLIVALGATAIRGVLGKAQPVGSLRGTVQPLADGSRLFVTIHPSALLRSRASGDYSQEYSRFVGDLRQVADLARDLP